MPGSIVQRHAVCKILTCKHARHVSIHTLIHTLIQALAESFTKAGCDNFVNPLVLNQPMYGCPKACRYNHTRQLVTMPCTDALPGDANLQAYAEQIIVQASVMAGYEFLVTFGKEIRDGGCKSIIPFVRRWGLTADIVCEERSSGLKGMIAYCPKTCGCTREKALCPKSCPAT